MRSFKRSPNDKGLKFTLFNANRFLRTCTMCLMSGTHMRNQETIYLSFDTAEYCTEPSSAGVGRFGSGTVEAPGIVISMYLYEADLEESFLPSIGLTTRVPASPYCSCSYEELVFDLVETCLSVSLESDVGTAAFSRK